MSDMVHFRQILASVAARLGVREAEADARGHCVMQLPDTFVSVTCPPEETEVKLTVPVAVISGAAPRAVLEHLLEANLFFKDTQGGTLSYTKSNGWVLLHLNLIADALDETMFFNAVDNMIKITSRISQEIAELMVESGAATGQSSGEKSQTMSGLAV